MGEEWPCPGVVLLSPKDGDDDDDVVERDADEEKEDDEDESGSYPEESRVVLRPFGRDPMICPAPAR